METAINFRCGGRNSRHFLDFKKLSRKMQLLTLKIDLNTEEGIKQKNSMAMSCFNMAFIKAEIMGMVF
jgi:hypothetical protein